MSNSANFHTTSVTRRIFALTGGIACGKSTVLKKLAEKGWLTLSADVLARKVVEPGSRGLQMIEEEFGEAFVKSDGSLDREKLGRHVFENPTARKHLESILHPFIREQAKHEIEVKCKESPGVPLVYEIPLFFESTMDYPEISKVIVVYTPESLSLERLLARSDLTSVEARQRIAAQMDIEEKKVRADYVIDNSGTMSELESHVQQFHENCFETD